MATPLEKLRREMTALESRHAELMRQRDERKERANALEAERRTTVATALAEGQQSPRENEKQLTEIQRLRQSADDFGEGIAALETKMAAARSELARAERDAAITSLEGELANVGKAGNALDGAVKQGWEATKALRDAVSRMCALLNDVDPGRWNAAFSGKLELDVRFQILRTLELVGRPDVPTQTPEVFSLVEPRLRSIIQQLRYENGEFRKPARGEKLYRVKSHVSGLRHLSLEPGCVIALTDAEVATFKNGEFELLPNAEAVA